jgi:hypothetical protein
MAATKKLRRLSDIAPSGGNYTRMEDIQERDLRLVDFVPQETHYGPGFLLTLVDDATNDAYEVLTSAQVVCKQLQKIRSQDDPFESLLVSFVKQGRAWVIV